jgi:hypothetical protein
MSYKVVMVGVRFGGGVGFRSCQQVGGSQLLA